MRARIVHNSAPSPASFPPNTRRAQAREPLGGKRRGLGDEHAAIGNGSVPRGGPRRPAGHGGELAAGFFPKDADTRPRLQGGQWWRGENCAAALMVGAGPIVTAGHARRECRGSDAVPLPRRLGRRQLQDAFHDPGWRMARRRKDAIARPSAAFDARATRIAPGGILQQLVRTVWSTKSPAWPSDPWWASKCGGGVHQGSRRSPVQKPGAPAASLVMAEIVGEHEQTAAPVRPAPCRPSNRARGSRPRG